MFEREHLKLFLRPISVDEVSHFDQRRCKNCMKLFESSEQECIPVGWVSPAAVAAFPLTHAP